MELGSSSDPQRRAFFVAQPNSGVVPFRVFFWDCSTAMDGVPFPSTWVWSPAPGEFLWDQSPFFLYTTPGPYIVYESVMNHSSTYPACSAEGYVSAYPPAAPSGGLGINNGATYTTSANVTLSLNHSPTATEMCFRQIPGTVWWTPWEPVAANRNWTLDTFTVMGGTPDGLHSVSVKYRDQYATESPVSTASITLVVTPPAGVLTLNNGAATTRDPNVQATWSATSNYGMQMCYAHYNEGTTFNIKWTPWQAYQPTSLTIPFSSKPGHKTVMVRFKDVAGNITHTQASILLKPASLPFLQLLLD